MSQRRKNYLKNDVLNTLLPPSPHGLEILRIWEEDIFFILNITGRGEKKVQGGIFFDRVGPLLDPRLY
jgi:hypothetical protein